MKIAIDARFYGPEGTGIGKYVEKLVEQLEQLDKENEYFIILRKNNFHLFNPKSANFQKILADARWYSLKEQALLPAVLAKIKPDLVHFPHFNIPLLYPGKFVVTIHDIIKSEFKGASYTTRALPLYLLKHSAYEITIRLAVRRAKKILVPSRFVKNKVIKKFGVEEDKIKVTYEAPDPFFVIKGKEEISQGRKREIIAKYGIKEPFILYVGNAYPYKNISIVLDALKTLPKLILVYASSRNVFTERLEREATEKNVRDQLILAGFVPNEDLIGLLKLAEAFIFPSLSEGFGLPGIEAMAVGCPVICSNIPVFKEVYEDAAVYFDPKNPRDVVDKLKFIILNSKFRIQLVKKGFDQVNKYSWETLAKETLEGYREVLENS